MNTPFGEFVVDLSIISSRSRLGAWETDDVGLGCTRVVFFFFFVMKHVRNQFTPWFPGIKHSQIQLWNH